MDRKEDNVEDVKGYNNKPVEEIIREIIKEYEERNGHELDEPFFIGRLGSVKKQLQTWRSFLPRIEMFHAMKCNSDPPLLKYLAELGTCFDCASKREIETILDLGVDPSRIVFSNTIKPVSALKYAKQKKIELMTFDNEVELDKIGATFPTARLLIRIQCKPTVDVLRNFGLKFGCPLDGVCKLLTKAKEENINVVGVHFHVGCFVTNNDVFKEALKNARSVFDIAEKIGLDLNILDIGGGFKGHGTTLEFKGLADKLNKWLEEYFPEDGNLRIIAEPGRYLATSLYTWALKIIGKRSNDNLQEAHVYEDDREYLTCPRFLYYVNDGAFGSKPNDIQFLSQLKPLRSEGIDKTVTYPSVVFGPTCSPVDVVYRDVALPQLYTGDWLYATNAGAYSISTCGDFNMIPRAFIIYYPDEAHLSNTDDKIVSPDYHK